MTAFDPAPGSRDVVLQPRRRARFLVFTVVASARAITGLGAFGASRADAAPWRRAARSCDGPRSRPAAPRAARSPSRGARPADAGIQAPAGGSAGRAAIR